MALPNIVSQTVTRSTTSLNLLIDARNVLLPVLGTAGAIVPGEKKQPIGTWKEQQGLTGLQGSAAQWRDARNVGLLPRIGIAILENDDPTLLPLFLAAAPVLAHTAGWTRTAPRPEDQHGGWIIESPLLRNVSLKTADGKHERASLRTQGRYQVLHGDHWDKPSQAYDGERYIFNGCPVMKLPDAQATALLALFGVYPTTPRSEPRKAITLPTGDEDFDKTSYALNLLDPDMSEEEWVFVGMGLHCTFGQAGVDLWDTWSSRGTKYKPGEPQKKAKYFKGSGKTFKYVLDLAYKVNRNWQKDWYAQRREARRKKSVPAAQPAESTTVALDTSFVDHFLGGVPDGWLALLRWLGKQAAVTLYIYVEAIRRGLHDKQAAVSAIQVANYAVKLGYTLITDLEKMEHTAREGLEFLLSEQVLTTEKNLASVVKTSPGPEKQYFPVSLADAFDALIDLASPRIEESSFPGYTTRQGEDLPVPVLADLRPEHFTGEYGATNDEAAAIAQDIAASTRPQRDQVAEHRAKRTKTNRLADLRNKLLHDQTVTPLPDGAMFCNYSEFDAARYLGKVQTDPTGIQFRQRDWCLFLGVAKGTLLNLRKDAGLKSKEQWQSMTLGNGPIDVQVREFARKVKGCPVEIEVFDPVTRTSYGDGYSVEACKAHRAAGRAVDVRFQTASITEIDPEGPQPRTPRSTSLLQNKEVPTEPRRFKPYYGPGFSKAWLWAQLALRLIRSGYTESDVVTLDLDDLIMLARGEKAQVDNTVPLASNPPEVTQEGQMWAPVTEVVEPEPAASTTTDKEWNFIPQWNQTINTVNFDDDLKADLLRIQLDRQYRGPASLNPQFYLPLTERLKAQRAAVIA